MNLDQTKQRMEGSVEALRKELAGRLEPEPAFTWTPQPAE